jgi:hypothetical protein
LYDDIPDQFHDEDILDDENNHNHEVCRDGWIQIKYGQNDKEECGEYYLIYENYEESCNSFPEHEWVWKDFFLNLLLKRSRNFFLIDHVPFLIQDGPGYFPCVHGNEGCVGRNDLHHELTLSIAIATLSGGESENKGPA